MAPLQIANRCNRAVPGRVRTAYVAMDLQLFFAVSNLYRSIMEGNAGDSPAHGDGWLGAERRCVLSHSPLARCAALRSAGRAAMGTVVTALQSPCFSNHR